MLEVIELSGPQQKAPLYEAYLGDWLWVIPDLYTKVQLQQQLLLKHSFVAEEKILRSSDLWVFLLELVRPDIHILSTEYTQALIKEFLISQGSSLSVQSLFAFMDKTLFLLVLPHSHEMVSHWFEENKDSRARWKSYYECACKVWDFLLGQKGVPFKWASGALYLEDLSQIPWKEKLVFDLSCRCRVMEVDIISQLPSSMDIKILVPSPSWGEQPEKTPLLRTLEVYKSFFTVNQKKASTAVPSFQKGAEASRQEEHQYFRFPHALSEVKHSVATVRKWLEKDKVPARNIAIFAPQMKRYWPALSTYLEQEGIPFHGDAVSAPRRALSSFLYWVASLRLHGGLLQHKEQEVEYLHYTFATERQGESKTEGEQKHHGNPTRPGPPWPYSHFLLERSLWLNDLKEVSFPCIKKKWVMESSTLLSREAFMDWAIPQWDSQASVDELKRVLSLFCQKSLPHIQLNLETWIGYLQALLSQPESRPEIPKEDCIHCVNLSFATASLEVTHRLFLGLTDKAFCPSGPSFLLEKDILQFMKILGGWDFPLMEEAYLEFEFHWIRETPAEKSFYCFSESDFLGELQVPSWFWLEKGPPKASSHDLCRWDKLQKHLQPSTLKSHARYRGVLRKPTPPHFGYGTG